MGLIAAWGLIDQQGEALVSDGIFRQSSSESTASKWMIALK